MACKECQENSQNILNMQKQVNQLAGHISSLCDQLLPSNDEDYLYSEALTAGGPAGSYLLKSPYIGQVQYRVDSLTGAGASGFSALVSPDLNVIMPGFLSTDNPTSENTPIKGYLTSGPSGANSSTVPCTSAWYALQNSENVLFIKIATTLAAYVTIQFRVKRKV